MNDQVQKAFDIMQIRDMEMQWMKVPIPVLFTTYNRLDYTKQTLEVLRKSKNVKVYVVDNGSTDGTRKFLRETKNLYIALLPKNTGVAGAMNHFLSVTREYAFVGKVDNDTIVPDDWALKLLEKLITRRIDIIQAKHPILKATHPQGFDAWMKTMQPDEQDPSIHYNHFVGGSGIIFRRNILTSVPTTKWKLGGWRRFQANTPKLVKAFCSDVEIKLLDTNENGSDYSKYPEYYKETQRA